MSEEREWFLMRIFKLMFKIYFGSLRKDLSRNGSLLISCIFTLLIASALLSSAVVVERISVPSQEKLMNTRGILTKVVPSKDGGRLILELTSASAEVVNLHLSEVGGAEKTSELARRLQGLGVSVEWFVAHRLGRTWNELVQIRADDMLVIDYKKQKHSIERWKAQHLVAVFLFFMSLFLFLLIQPIRYFRSQTHL